MVTSADKEEVDKAFFFCFVCDVSEEMFEKSGNSVFFFLGGLKRFNLNSCNIVTNCCYLPADCLSKSGLVKNQKQTIQRLKTEAIRMIKKNIKNVLIY